MLQYRYLLLVGWAQTASSDRDPTGSLAVAAGLPRLSIGPHRHQREVQPSAIL